MDNESGGVKKKMKRGQFISLSFTSFDKKKENKSFVSFSHLYLSTYMKHL